LILFVESISKNPDMYVPAYPLPIMEIGSFVKWNMPEVEIGVISVPVDYGLPLSQAGKEQIYRNLLRDISDLKPKGVGISCTAISQAEESISLCEQIKTLNPDIFVFLGGYFPTIYYEEIFSRTEAVDLIVTGEGEIPALKITEMLEKGLDPRDERIPNLAWKADGQVRSTEQGRRFDLGRKALLNLELLRYPRSYEILPYAFSRGCPYQCNFCMEDFIRPRRKEVPPAIVQSDLIHLSRQAGAHTLLVSDALFKSFDLFPLIRSLDMKVNFETRCDVLAPSQIPQIADSCGILALGFESASYGTLKRMNKVRDKAHYEKYISNTVQIFSEAVKNEIPIMVFMIAGYPGDTEEDLETTLLFAKKLSENRGPGGHVFKIGECRVYPKTQIYDVALSSPDVVFEDNGVFGENIVTHPSRDLNFETILKYMGDIFHLSNNTPKLLSTLSTIMPFFRLPAHALNDDMIPKMCFMDEEKTIFNVHANSLSAFRELVPELSTKYKRWMSQQRSARNLPF
jgi:radical SAM superfamily enzyme YgiQ (UPF0313 family)